MLFPGSPWCLAALAELARRGSFSDAARALHITQPALSLRIKQLEEIVGHQLVRRARKGLILTPLGMRMLDYINLRELIDQEVTRDFGSAQEQELSGLVRIAGHYSILLHAALPALKKFLCEHPRVQIESIIREDDHVPPLFERGECDFALLQRPIQKDIYHTFFLGYERYVLIQSNLCTTRQDVYIDSDPSDDITDEFFKRQRAAQRPKHYDRSFLHNETGIVRAVALGLGRAVVAEKEIAKGSGVTKMPGFKPLLLPAYLQCSKYVEGSRLFKQLRDALAEGMKKILAAK